MMEKKWGLSLVLRNKMGGSGYSQSKGRQGSIAGPRVKKRRISRQSRRVRGTPVWRIYRNKNGGELEIENEKVLSK